jgi:FkbM family methyltransferase
VRGKELLKTGLISVLGYEQFLYCTSLFRVKTFQTRKLYEDFRYFTTLIPKGTAVLDIGANIGVTTHYLATHLPANSIFSFEPIPQNFSTLKKLVGVKRLRNVKLFNVGIGKEEGKLTMILPVVNGVRRHTLARIWDENNCFDQGEKFTIPVKPIDSITALKDHTVKAIKIDVEGYEYPVLQGAINLIKRNKPIIFCELSNSPNSLQAIDLLKSLGYTLKGFCEGRLYDVDMCTYRGGDYFFLPSS